jgi:hypothetical protein
MSFPKQSEIELPLLRTLQELGGKAEPKELYPKLAEIFPQLTEEDLTARLPSSPSTFRWHNLVQWSRQKLVEKDEIDARCLEADATRPSACDGRGGEFFRGTAARASSDAERFGIRERI